MGIWSRLALLLRIRTNAALDEAEDPRQVLDYAYREQQMLLRKVQQGLVEVVAAKAQLEHQARQLHERVPRLEDQARRALAAEREDLARAALQRKHTILAELDALSRQAADIDTEEKKLTTAQLQLAGRIEEFRTRRTAMSARYNAAEAQVMVREALTGVSGQLAELGMAVGRAEEKTERLQARASALDALIDSGALAQPLPGGDTIEWELRAVDADRSVDQEIAALMAERKAAQIPSHVDSP